MPAFPVHTIGFGVGLAAAHGLAPSVASPASASVEQLAAGRGLVAAEKGFACVTCHGVADKPPLQVFEVQGVNFALVAQRLRYDYFLRWMRNPQRVDPSTKMARYADPQGKTGLTQVFGGDADRQFAAIWVWLESLR
jgi:mono/diheme cytochrome c family protein